MGRLRLTCSDRAGQPCLRIDGNLVDLAGNDIERRLAVVPTAVVDALGRVDRVQPTAGRFERDGAILCWIPRFPFVAGTSYSLLFDGRPAASIRCPAIDARPNAHVVAIYPSGPVVPVNLLKLYVQFSTRMSEGCARDGVRVCRADDGAPLDVLLETMHELWDPSRTRLTVLLDPGRIKRGLVPNREAGYPLTEGQAVVVSVDSGFRDAGGQPLCQGAATRYEVDPAVRARVDPSKWRLKPPPAESVDALLVDFDRPLDRALLEHCLCVRGEAGAPLAGRAVVGDNELSWRFEPHEPWTSGRYVLSVDRRLEDLAGNSLVRVFDRDLSRPEDDPRDLISAEIGFECGAAHSASSNT